ncbi:MAG: four helix bundle protein [Vicingaceae bacterium]
MYREKENPLKEKSYAFALKIARIVTQIQLEKKEYVLSKQLLRAGTSIGANVEEAIGGQSNKDFLHKISIAYKEARESHYWLRLLIDLEKVNNKVGKELLIDAEELLKIITAIQRTLKAKLNS